MNFQFVDSLVSFKLHTVLELQRSFDRDNVTKYEYDKIGNQVAFAFTRVSLAHLPIKTSLVR